MAVNKVIYGGTTLVDLTGDTVTAADLADGVKATGADGNPVIGLMQKVTIEAELSTTSTNPVQNKVIKEALDDKLGKTETASAATQDGAGNNIVDTYAKKSDVSALLSTKLGVNSTAYAATRDGAGNNIVDTYAKKTDISGFVKTVNGTVPDTNGNVAINVSGGGSGGGGVSTSEVNTWTAKQIFNDITISGVKNFEYLLVDDDTITPTSSYTLWTFTDPVGTLNLDGLISKANNLLHFEVLFNGAGNSAPTLKIISTGNYAVICPTNTRCSNAFNMLHGVIIKDASGGRTDYVVFIKIDAFDNNWGDTTL